MYNIVQIMQITFEKLADIRSIHGQDSISYTAGCFDVLHTGHLAMMDMLRESADASVVGITPDTTIVRKKGPLRPVQNQLTRHAVIDLLKTVDYSFITPEMVEGYRFVGHAVLEALRPDVFLTTDEAWENDRLWIERQGTEMRIVERPGDSDSTTKTIDRLLARYKNLN